MRATTLAAVLIAVSVPVPLPAAPQGQNRKQDIEQQLQSQYPPTKLAGDKLRIAQPGSVLLVQIDGMFASPMSEFAFANSYKDGRIKRSAASALIHNAQTSRELQAGEKVYLLKTEVKDAGIVFSLQSCIACDGSDVDLVQMAYRASLTFQYPKGYWNNTGFAQIQQTISEVFAFANGPAPSTQPNPEPIAPRETQMAQQPPPAAPEVPAASAVKARTDLLSCRLLLSRNGPPCHP